MVTTILGFTEINAAGRLHNSAAVFHRGKVAGVYRKVHPAINWSVYDAGDQIPVFTVDNFTFGVLICNDSNFPDLAKTMASKGAAALFIPTNCGLLPEKADVTAAARRCDIAIAKENGIPVIRADVAGRAEGRVSYGCSSIVDQNGIVLQSAQPLCEDLLVANLEI
jgi:predicted amidohydrolase